MIFFAVLSFVNNCSRLCFFALDLCFSSLDFQSSLIMSLGNGDFQQHSLPRIFDALAVLQVASVCSAISLLAYYDDDYWRVVISPPN